MNILIIDQDYYQGHKDIDDDATQQLSDKDPQECFTRNYTRKMADNSSWPAGFGGFECNNMAKYSHEKNQHNRCVIFERIADRGLILDPNAS